VEEAFGWSALAMFNYMVRPPTAQLTSSLQLTRPWPCVAQTPLAGFVDEEMTTTHTVDVSGMYTGLCMSHVAIHRLLFPAP